MRLLLKASTSMTASVRIGRREPKYSSTPGHPGGRRSRHSRLMSVDDHGTVRAIEAARGVFREHTSASGGRVIDTAGDSVLAVIDTASGAVFAAMAVRLRLSALAAELPEGKRMRFRIGIHLGDVIEKADGTVYGDGVNIAARLQSMVGIYSWLCFRWGWATSTRLEPRWRRRAGLPQKWCNGGWAQNRQA
jgi:predicted transcriptional regulator